MTPDRPRPAIVDTHVHLDDPAFDHDREAVLAASREAGVVGFINIGYRPASWEASRILRDEHANVAIVIGLHPGHADEFSSDLDTAMTLAIRDFRPVAVGETGFDFSRKRPSFEDQTRAFQRQLEISREEDLPVVIHQRDAAEALMAELDRWPDLRRVVLHSFDGDRRLMDWARERDCFIGVGGLATRPAAANLRLILARAPHHRLLLETDAPYLTPPGLVSRRNSPANLSVIAANLAEIWGMSMEHLCEVTLANATDAFGVDFSIAAQAHGARGNAV